MQCFGLFDHLLTPPAGPSHHHPPPCVCLPFLRWRNHLRQHHRLHRLPHRHTFACTRLITQYFPLTKNVTRQPDAPCSPHLRLSFRLLLLRILPPAGQSLTSHTFGPSPNPSSIASANMLLIPLHSSSTAISDPCSSKSPPAAR
jgi:hypothetical protein